MGIKKDDIKSIFGAVLKEERTKRNISHVELEERSGITRKHIYNLEKGVHEPTVSNLFKLALALEIGPDEMIRLVQNKLKN